MAKNLEAKCKLCRRAGEKLMLKGERCVTQKCAIIKRNYPPGFHGPTKGSPKLSDYGTQLYEKQKAKRTYHILEKQFRITFDRAQKIKGDSGKNLLKLLELRFDNVIYRLGIADSRVQARQLVNHGHFKINNRKVNIPSYSLKSGDVITLRDSSKRSAYFKKVLESSKKNELPGWLNVDRKTLESKVLSLPGDDDIIQSINTQMIVEFYSR